MTLAVKDHIVGVGKVMVEVVERIEAGQSCMLKHLEANIFHRLRSQ